MAFQGYGQSQAAVYARADGLGGPFPNVIFVQRRLADGRLGSGRVLQRRRFVHHIRQVVAIRELGKAQIACRHLRVFDL